MSTGVISRAAVACALIAAAGALAATAPASSAAAPALPSAPASAAAPTTTTALNCGATIKIGKSSYKNGYVTPNVTINQGQTLCVNNNSKDLHSVTSDAIPKKGYGEGLLFDTTVDAFKKVAVPGAESLPGGKYGFHCRFHTVMKGTLTIKGSGGSLPKAPSFDQPLKLPPVLSGPTPTIHIEEAHVQVLPAPAPKTRMWTYNGTYPGPTIVRPAGHDTKVTFVNDITTDPSNPAFTVHFHGDHHKSSMDGQSDSYLIHPGRSRTYNWPLTDHGQPEPAATMWYHDHRMLATTHNNAMGLQGIFEITDGKAAKLGLPTGSYDLPLMVSDRNIASDGTLTPPPVYTTMEIPNDAPASDLAPGDHILVDGRYLPYKSVKTHRYLLRLVNTSPTTPYDFALSDGSPFVQVGTGNSYLPKPLVRSDILVGPAQRADVIVDFHGDFGKHVDLISRSSNQATEPTPAKRLMRFKVTKHANDSTKIPSKLVATPKITVPSKVSKTWNIGVKKTSTGKKYWTINGHMFNPTRVDYTVPLGATQLWKLKNSTNVTHFFHIHEEQWHTVSRNGGPPKPWERGLQDTWKLNPGDVVTVAAHFTNYTGTFMLHCHMLTHEDHGLMAQFEVKKPTTATASTTNGVAQQTEASPVTASQLLLSPVPTRSSSYEEPLLAALTGQRSWLTSLRGLMCRPGH